MRSVCFLVLCSSRLCDITIACCLLSIFIIILDCYLFLSHLSVCAFVDPCLCIGSHMFNHLSSITSHEHCFPFRHSIKSNQRRAKFERARAASAARRSDALHGVWWRRGCRACVAAGQQVGWARLGWAGLGWARLGCAGLVTASPCPSLPFSTYPSLPYPILPCSTNPALS